ncbi:hypothetical protein HW555_006104 [Spodoptera exigua]|uniref:Uncharacterized protein n=1 Tax=Spodoptera exigua TaxID=7107 RepID=A0A835L5P5_SPOEX|nr:hypothetical protein HW555_006104 [Spodoptera exigua]
MMKHTEQDMEMQDNSPMLGSSHSDTIPVSSTIPAPRSPFMNAVPRPRQRRQSRLDEHMDQLINIEERKLESELITTQEFSKLSENIGNIAIALTSIANAISDVARKMPNP